MSIRSYHPPVESGPLGALIFLHGDFGNLIDWRPIWRSFADRERLAIFTPTYRWGFWDAGGVSEVDTAYEFAQNDIRIDPDRIFLVGHSDGGKGVSHAVARGSGRYGGLIYISPNMADYTGLYLVSKTVTQREITDPSFSDRWRGTRALILQGDRDWSVPVTTVDRAAADLRRMGVDVSYHVFPGQGHALFFTRRSEIFDAIAAWMGPKACGPEVSP